MTYMLYRSFIDLAAFAEWCNGLAGHTLPGKGTPLKRVVRILSFLVLPTTRSGVDGIEACALVELEAPS